MDERAVRVAVPVPVRGTFTYRVPAGSDVPPKGARVLVPFGPRKAVGVVLGEEKAEGRELREIAEILDEGPAVPEVLLDLAAWVSEYYLAPMGECVKLVAPPLGMRISRGLLMLVDGSGREDDPIVRALRDEGPQTVQGLFRLLGAEVTGRLATLRRAGVVRVEHEVELSGFREREIAVLTASPGTVPARARAQAAVLLRIREAGGRLAVADLVREVPSWRGALGRLVTSGHVRLERERDPRRPHALEGEAGAIRQPTPEQASAIGRIVDSLERHTFDALLLHGVTGSGKTEVYFRAAEAAFERGRSAIILVPEIALTPMLVRAARARFGDEVAVLHSELSAGERHDEWWRIRDGETRLVIGARSAVFAPVRNLGLLVIDEEHEGAYKQEEGARYNGRDVAVVRARLEGAVALLGSATPSAESRSNALSGKYTSLCLTQRIGSQGLPSVQIVDRRKVIREGGDAILSPTLREALRLRLERKEQALLLLNRRGFATSLLCRECGEQALCPNCSVSLTLHHGGRLSICHYCGHQAQTTEKCPSCGGVYLKLSGFGTEKVALAVADAFPKARVARVDRDTLSRKGALAKTLETFEAGEIDFLVGTQMIAKGHDFPKVTLVGVVDADVGLGMPDFRSAERTFQLLTQVAGRAGRADLAGEVILQSHLPDHYAVTLSCEQDYPAFYAREMEFRRSMGYPPTTALVNIILKAKDAAAGGEVAARLGRRLRDVAPGRFRVLGPALAPLARLKGEHRFQILLKGRRQEMRAATERALTEEFGPDRWPGVVVDVDPVSVM